jgi:DNA-directed RNA polymerase specialized sigma24 family protein
VAESELTTDERTHAADLFEAHSEEVVSRLVRNHRSVDPAMLYDAFVRALLEITRAPEKFDRDRGTPLADFLYGAAGQQLRTMLRSDTRRQHRDQEKGKSLVAEKESAARSILDTIATAEEAERLRERAAQTPEEREVLRLWELGYSDAEIADDLQLDLSAARQVRDRVVQRLRRLRPSEEES